VIAADRLGQIRTGAASRVATRYLARADAATVGLIGTGGRPASSPRSAPCARCATCWPTARDAERRRRFLRGQSAALGVPVEPAPNAVEAVSGRDIVITCTTSRTPVALGSWLAPGQHINAVGGNHAERRELDVHAVVRAARVAIDSREQGRMEAGELILAANEGVLRWEQVVELGEIVGGQAPGRGGPEEITLFKSLGVALEDVAVAAHVPARVGGGRGRSAECQVRGRRLLAAFSALSTQHSTLPQGPTDMRALSLSWRIAGAS
jgi:ornithine cyclodeaminase/alanine dehydrogenase-like protein (mu-crystallin family)